MERQLLKNKGKSNLKHRSELFKLIRDRYKKDIVTFDLSVDNLMIYADATKYINNLLIIIEPRPTNKELGYTLGAEFFKWYSKTQYEIMNMFCNMGV